MVWNGFCIVREHSKVIFCWLHFFQLCSIGVETAKYFFEKKFEKFEILTRSELDFALKKSTINDFFLTSCFSPLQYRVRNSEKKWFFEKKTWKNSEIVKWSEMDYALLKSTKKWFFAGFTFLTCAVYGAKTVKKTHFLKKLQKF